MPLKAAVGALFILSLTAPSLCAQDRPFVFSLTTASDTSKAQVLVDYDVGFGERTFHSSTENRPEQRVGVQASLGRWTLVSRFGLASVGDSYQSSQQGEALFSVFRQASSGMSLAMGGGILHEAGGINVVQARIVGGRDYQHMRLHGNALFQKPLAAARDPVDLITTIGWARRLNTAVSLGVEAVGEDLEAFWEPAEAEGGARLLVGPSLHIAPQTQKWQLSMAGGPTFHPSDTGRSSAALRDLPPTTRTHGYALRISFATTF